ncbi:DUF59 domain-containing protein [bacterium]|nr:DUF59 domain-containing protein [bacterium]
MADNITRDDVINAIENVEHPEIAVTLMNLGMIKDVTVKDGTASVTFAIPMLGIPDAVKIALAQSIQQPVESLGVELSVDFTEMTPEIRDKFLKLSSENWKGSI